MYDVCNYVKQQKEANARLLAVYTVSLSQEVGHFT